MHRICSLNNVPRPPDIANIRNALKLVVLGIKKGKRWETERIEENDIEVDLKRKVL